MKKVSHRRLKQSHKRSAKQNRIRGFTIIEVMIVLAIAGLIMLIVFILIPTVKQKARDYDRKYTSTFVLTQINQYRTDHGSYPTSAERCAFMQQYLTEQISPTASCTYDATRDCMFIQGYKYNFCFHTAATSSHSYPFNMAQVDNSEISLQVSHWCTQTGVTSQTGDPIESTGNDTIDTNYIVVWVPMERARLFCIDNH